MSSLADSPTPPYMSLDHYNKAALISTKMIMEGVTHEGLRRGAAEANMEYDGFVSLTRNLQAHHNKRTHLQTKQSFPLSHSLYFSGHTLPSLSVLHSIPVYNLARMMVERVTGIKGKGLTEAMKYPKQRLEGFGDVVGKEGRIWRRKKEIEDGEGGDVSDFCFSSPPNSFPSYDSSGTPSYPFYLDVINAIESDPINGPRHDAYRRQQGMEYEVLLNAKLENLGVCFKTEEELRGDGMAKTPDVVLEVPIGVKGRDGKWRIVRWIDSKALFADPVTHKHEVCKQAEGYVHRYGPGCVVYWFGYGGWDQDEEEDGWFWCGGGMQEFCVLPDGGVL